MFLEEHRHSSRETPRRAFLAYWWIGIHRSWRAERQQRASCNSSSNSNNDSNRTQRFHNQPIATRFSISSLGILLTTVAPLPALIRQLVVSWLLARTAASYQRDHTVLFTNGEACAPAKTERTPTTGFACRFQTNSTAYLTISISSLSPLSYNPFHTLFAKISED